MHTEPCTCIKMIQVRKHQPLGTLTPTSIHFEQQVGAGVAVLCENMFITTIIKM